MKLLHLTDTHFIPPGETLYGRDPSIALAAAIADINAHHRDAELAVVTGDLTHWGEDAAFAHLAATLKGLEVPYRLLIGNHDRRDAFARHFPEQAFDAGGFVQSVVETSAGRFLLLDTMLDGTHAGHYCEERLAWLAEQLAAAKGQPLFLFMHHPPFTTYLPRLDRIGLQQARQFRAVVEPYARQVRHLFFGHVHRPIAGSWLGIPVSALRAMNHQVAFAMTEERDLPGSFEPPAYCVAKIDTDSVVVHFHDFLDDSQRFALHDSPWNDWSRKYSHP
jgi:3',5'-cyclic AMP phosphodiesterase CpdA